MTEIFDIVDRDDRVIGQTNEQDARANGSITRAVYNVVMDQQGRILFQFRTATRKTFPRRFDGAAVGKVMAGESYDMAVRRETYEELGIDVTPQYIGKVLIEEAGRRPLFMATYLTQHEGPFTGWENEAECLEWMHVNEYRSLYKRFPYLFCQAQSLNMVMDYVEKENA